MDNRDNDDQSQVKRMDPVAIPKALVPIFGLLVLVGLLITSWYKVQPDERGVVLIFGKYSNTVGPGLHFKLPFGIQTVEKVAVTVQQKVEFGYRTSRAGVRTQYERQDYPQESLIVTGDLSIADVEWEVQYKIHHDPTNYLFKVKNHASTFRVMNESVMREVIGDRLVTEVLTTGRSEIQSEVKRRMQLLCDKYQMGVSIDNILLQDVNPPEEVKPAFDAVNKAQQEQQTLVNQADQEYQKAIPKAKGEAQQRIQEARGYAIERVNQAQGDANRFLSVYEAYQKAPEITRQRMYLETMEKVMQQTGNKYITDGEGSGILPLLNLSPGK